MVISFSRCQKSDQAFNFDITKYRKKGGLKKLCQKKQDSLIRGQHHLYNHTDLNPVNNLFSKKTNMLWFTAKREKAPPPATEEEILFFLAASLQ